MKNKTMKITKAVFDFLLMELPCAAVKRPFRILLKSGRNIYHTSFGSNNQLAAIGREG